ncbi:thioredoxin family protein [Azohydromonas caseinilytica]|uniref:Thioredoxin family protein n=1 Tax=Azohydromonas caseinilytica TaxID=2728836 RepID=A0A848FEM0_9BURK|nr:thioredoxin family protein [Azohydromonas caseinilytica]NML16799.1 thioredoxin family protein [Azohydromonas caseinilytica]
MAFNPHYAAVEPTRAEVDALRGATVLEFGAPWCGFCMAAQPDIAQALDATPDVRHLRVEDGKGRPLGRSFKVKLWPTLVLLQDGQEIARLVRPQGVEPIRQALQQFQSPGGLAD